MNNLSILIATLNCKSQIRRCIESIQIYSDQRIDIIVQDGGSTDGTLDILRSMKIDFISENDAGIYDAFNKALKRVSTDWVMFLGADDRLLLNPISIIEGIKPPYRNIYYGNVINQDTGLLYDGKFSKFKIARKNICHQGILYHVSAFKKNYFDLKYRFLSDYDFNLKLIADGYGLIYIDRVLAIYGNSGVSKLGDEAFEADRMRNIFNRLGAFVFLFYFIVRIIKKIYHMLRVLKSILNFKSF